MGPFSALVLAGGRGTPAPGPGRAPRARRPTTSATRLRPPRPRWRRSALRRPQTSSQGPAFIRADRAPAGAGGRRPRGGVLQRLEGHEPGRGHEGAEGVRRPAVIILLGGQNKGNTRAPGARGGRGTGWGGSPSCSANPAPGARRAFAQTLTGWATPRWSPRWPRRLESRRLRMERDPGEVVLLSPACASFDEFKSYGRGESLPRENGARHGARRGGGAVTSARSSRW